jgi:hypothetical protein
MCIREGKTADPGWKIFGSGINIPDPQNWIVQYTTTVRSVRVFENNYSWKLGKPEFLLQY